MLFPGLLWNENVRKVVSVSFIKLYLKVLFFVLFEVTL